MTQPQEPQRPLETDADVTVALECRYCGTVASLKEVRRSRGTCGACGAGFRNWAQASARVEELLALLAQAEAAGAQLWAGRERRTQEEAKDRTEQERTED